jgi:hypothetical protein
MRVNPLKVKMKGEGLNASHVMCNKWLYFYQLCLDSYYKSVTQP